MATKKKPANAGAQKAQNESNAWGSIPIPEMPAQTTPVAPGTGGSGTGVAPAVDARTVLKAYLKRYELDGLSEQAFSLLSGQQITDKTDINVIGELLKDTKVYKDRFVGNVALEKAGKATYTITDYLDFEKGYKDAMQGSGLPATFYDSPDDYAAFMVGDTSVAEVKRRVDNGFRLVKDANPEVIKQMKSLYNVSDGDLAAYFLDPKKGTEILERQAAAADRSAQAQLQAGMQLTSTQAEGLVADKVSSQSAKEGFTEIGQSQGLYSNLIGENDAITQEEQIGATFGTNQAAAQRVAQRKRRRAAEFDTGGSYSANAAGIQGLGSANK